MKSLFDKHFFIGFVLGGLSYSLISILVDIFRLAKLYASGVLVLP